MLASGGGNHTAGLRRDRAGGWGWVGCGMGRRREGEELLGAESNRTGGKGTEPVCVCWGAGVR